MDRDRFDSFTRTITSRRAVSGAIVSSVAGLLGLAQIQEAAAGPCPPGKKRCRKRCIPRARCCTTAQCKPRNSGQVCRRGHCVCPAGTKRCGKLCLPPAAACPPQPDAFCRSGGGSPIGIPVSQRVAQTFTPPNGGHLTASAMWIRNFSSEPLGFTSFRCKQWTLVLVPPWSRRSQWRSLVPRTASPIPTMAGCLSPSRHRIGFSLVSSMRLY